MRSSDTFSVEEDFVSEKAGTHEVPTSIGHMHHTLSYSVQLSTIDTLLSVIYCTSLTTIPK